MSNIAASATVAQAARVYGNRCVVSSTFISRSVDTVSWTDIVIRLGDGTTKTVTDGNTGSMSGRTYLYADATESAPLTLETTRNICDIGVGDVLVAVVEHIIETDSTSP